MYSVVGIPVTDFARLAELKGMKFYGFRREDAAVDAAAAAATGWNKGENNVPTQSAATLGDSNSGIHLTIGILAALLQREHTGEGTFVYQSMQDAVLNLCRIKLRNQIMLDNLGALPHYAVYPNWKWGKAIPRAENTEGGQVIGWTYKAKGWENDPNAYVYIVVQNSDKSWAAIANTMGHPPRMDYRRTLPRLATPSIKQGRSLQVH